MLNEDYRDMLRALSDEKVRFILVGAYALAAHGYPRATMDIDIWVMPSPENADAVLRALRRFGAPLHNLTKEDLQKDGTIFQIGVAPSQHNVPAFTLCSNKFLLQTRYDLFTVFYSHILRLLSF